MKKHLSFNKFLYDISNIEMINMLLMNSDLQTNLSQLLELIEKSFKKVLNSQQTFQAWTKQNRDLIKPLINEYRKHQHSESSEYLTALSLLRVRFSKPNKEINLIILIQLSVFVDDFIQLFEPTSSPLDTDIVDVLSSEYLEYKNSLISQNESIFHKLSKIDMPRLGIPHLKDLSKQIKNDISSLAKQEREKDSNQTNDLRLITLRCVGILGVFSTAIFTNNTKTGIALLLSACLITIPKTPAIFCTTKPPPTRAPELAKKVIDILNKHLDKILELFPPETQTRQGKKTNRYDHTMPTIVE